MFGKKYESLVAGVTIEDYNDDLKNGKRLGQYRLGAKAIYKPDYTYVPLEAVTGSVQDKTAVHVSGCCAGGVPVDRVVLETNDGKFQFIFDKKKDAEILVAAVSKYAKI